MKTLTKYLRLKSVNNQAIIEEEESGFGKEFVQAHRTSVCNPELKERLTKMSVVEIIH